MEINDFDRAIYTTYNKYGKKQVYGVIANILDKNDLCGITRDENARDNAINLGIEKVREIILGRFVERVLRNQKDGLGKNALETAIIKTYQKYSDNPRVDEIILSCISDLVDGLESDEYFENDVRKILEGSGLNINQKIIVQYISEETGKEILEQIEKENNKTENQNVMRPSNIRTFPQNIQKAQNYMAVKHGLDFKLQQGQIADISLGDQLFASTSIGNIRKNQEDAVILIQHPRNPNFKFLAVSDGMGGHEKGEVASYEVVRQMKNWFESLDPIHYEDMKFIPGLMRNKLREISENISRNYPESGATFSGAIVGKDETIIGNVGDSRAYVTKDGELMQVTEDDSMSWQKYKQGRIETKDDIRFDPESNQITQCIGNGIDPSPHLYRINNRYYDKLLLVSDGVTDCLRDDQISVITKYTDRKKLANSIVKSSLEQSFLDKGITAGKDNTTVALYDNTKKDPIEFEMK